MAQTTPTVAERLAKWKRVEMPFSSAGLSAREIQMVGDLADACRSLDEVFWRQSDSAGFDLYNTTKDPGLKRLLGIMGSRWDLLDENRPFVGEPMPPGHDLYPHGLTHAQIDQYVAQHPEDRAAIYNPYTVVKWRDGRLIGGPYHEEYKALLDPAARSLREAADLSGDPAFAGFLRLRAAALLTDDYYQSDLAWLDLKNPKFDVIFAPYETYLDDLLGVKTSYGAAVLDPQRGGKPEARRLREVRARNPGRSAPRPRRPPFQARSRHAHGSDGRALPRRRPAPRLPGGGRQPSQRPAHPPGERGPRRSSSRTSWTRASATSSCPWRSA